MACNDVVETPISGAVKTDVERNENENNGIEQIKISIPQSDDFEGKDKETADEFISQRTNPPKTPDSDDDDDNDYDDDMDDDDKKEEFEKIDMGTKLKPRIGERVQFSTIIRNLDKSVELQPKVQKRIDELLENIENAHNQLTKHIADRKDMLLREVNSVKKENDETIGKIMLMHKEMMPFKAKFDELSSNGSTEQCINCIHEAVTFYRESNDDFDVPYFAHFSSKILKMSLLFDQMKLKYAINQMYKLESETNKENREDVVDDEHANNDDAKKQNTIAHAFYNPNHQKHTRLPLYAYHPQTFDQNAMPGDHFNAYYEENAFDSWRSYERKRGKRRGRRSRYRIDDYEYGGYGYRRSKRGRVKSYRKENRDYSGNSMYNDYHQQDVYQYEHHGAFEINEINQIVQQNNTFICSQHECDNQHNGSVADLDEYQNGIDERPALQKPSLQKSSQWKATLNERIRARTHHIFVQDTEDLDYSSIKQQYRDVVVISQFSSTYISNNGLRLDTNRTILKRVENQTHGYAVLSGKPAVNGKHCWRIKCENFKPWIFIGVCKHSKRYTDSSWNNKDVWGITTCSQSNKNGEWSTNYRIAAVLKWKKRDLLHLDMLLDCDIGRITYREISESEYIKEPVTIWLEGLKNSEWTPHFNLHTIGSTVTARKIPYNRFGQIW